MNDSYVWKIRCAESGYIVGECGCHYCYQEFELDNIDDTEVEDEYDIWSDEEFDWIEDIDFQEDQDEDDEFWEAGILE